MQTYNIRVNNDDDRKFFSASPTTQSFDEFNAHVDDVLAHVRENENVGDYDASQWTQFTVTENNGELTIKHGSQM